MHYNLQERIVMNMRKILILVYVLALTLSLTSCAGTGDWSYKLPNNYEVWHINSTDVEIKCVDLEDEGEMIPSFVKEFSYDERYVYSRNVEDIYSNNVAEEIYYALDTMERKVYGPFNSIEELKKQTDEWNVVFPEKWYRTSPDPNIMDESSQRKDKKK